jgi:hypothetical protein
MDSLDPDPQHWREVPYSYPVGTVPFTFSTGTVTLSAVCHSSPKECRGSGFNWVPESGCRFSIRIRIQEGKNDPRN